MPERTDRIWSSDCNDALEIQLIQRWTGTLLPPELIGAHVSPTVSHTTGRVHTLDFRSLWVHGEAVYALAATATGVWSPPGRVRLPGLHPAGVYRISPLPPADRPEGPHPGRPDARRRRGAGGGALPRAPRSGPGPPGPTAHRLPSRSEGVIAAVVVEQRGVPLGEFGLHHPADDQV
ncbi:alpha-galactosidase [Actinoplanes sp. NPDC049681]|uniref:alpha-galactosidase n=1 Tax=Actinoplanes sp. NPDC049681 TaxID=3363905 RepID=UPI0037AC86BD